MSSEIKLIPQARNIAELYVEELDPFTDEKTKYVQFDGIDIQYKQVNDEGEADAYLVTVLYRLGGRDVMTSQWKTNHLPINPGQLSMRGFSARVEAADVEGA